MHINNFPTELLEEIFLCSISQPEEQVPFPLFTRCGSSSASPSAISKICKRWHDIALNFAPLWTHLHVVDPQDVSIVQDLAVWLLRAGNLPLCLSLRQSQGIPRTSSGLHATAAVMRLFLNSLQRCRSLEIFGYPPPVNFDLEKIKSLPSACSSLESVSICFPGGGSWAWKDSQMLSNILLNTHSLHTIRWLCGFFPHDTTPHPWENLRELSAEQIGALPSFFSALSHCQRLQRLTIHEKSIVDRYPSNPIPAILPRLTHLSVQFRSQDSSQAILRPLILPSLADLELVLVEKLVVWSPILALLKRSGAVLSRLAITHGTLPRATSPRLYQPGLIQVLKMSDLQELRVLQVEEPLTGGCGIVKMLTLPTDSNACGSDPGYLVHLERICLDFEGVGKVKLSRFWHRLVESRLGARSGGELIKTNTQIRLSLSIPFLSGVACGVPQSPL